VSHPARERPAAAFLYVLVIAASGVLATIYMGNNPWWGMVGAGLLFLSGWSFFLPVRYTMDAEGVRKRSVFGVEERKWHRVKSVVPDRYGVLLSPFPEPTMLAKFRGLSIQFSGNREEVLEFIGRHTRGNSRDS